MTRTLFLEAVCGMVETLTWFHRDGHYRYLEGSWDTWFYIQSASDSHAPGEAVHMGDDIRLVSARWGWCVTLQPNVFHVPLYAECLVRQTRIESDALDARRGPPRPLYFSDESLVSAARRAALAKLAVSAFRVGLFATTAASSVGRLLAPAKDVGMHHASRRGDGKAGESDEESDSEEDADLLHGSDNDEGDGSGARLEGVGLAEKKEDGGHHHHHHHHHRHHRHHQPTGLQPQHGAGVPIRGGSCIVLSSMRGRNESQRGTRGGSSTSGGSYVVSRRCTACSSAV